METANITIKLLIDTEANKVVFAEASKDFVDLLFFLLSLPIASVIKLVTCESMVGSIANLYTSFADLNESNLQPTIHKNFLLNPRILSPVTDIPLFIDKSSILSPGNFYTCRQCNYKAHIMNMFDGAYCPSCGQWMNHETKVVAASETGTTVAPLSGGYVNEMITYMVSDDLSVTPISTMSIISMTNRCNAYKLEERKVNIGNEEALKLLKTTFKSTTVLSDVFLKEEEENEEEQGGEEGGSSNAKADNALSLCNSNVIVKAGETKAKPDNSQQQKCISSRLSAKREQKDCAFASKKPAQKAKTVQKLNKPKKLFATAFAVFVVEFTKIYQEENPNNESVSAIVKASTEKWRQMSEAEKAPYQAKADKRKSDYEKKLMAYIKKLADDDLMPYIKKLADDEYYEDGSGEDES